MISLHNQSCVQKDITFNRGNSHAIMKSKKGKIPIHTIFCPICGNAEAGNHLHYGGRGCSSCRAFFRRAVQNDSYNVSNFFW